MSDLEIAVFPKEDAGEFRTILKEQDIKYSERAYIRDSADSGGITFLGDSRRSRSAVPRHGFPAGAFSQKGILLPQERAVRTGRNRPFLFFL